MAGHKELDVVESMLKCNICLKEVFDNRQLQCQHVFCLECLESNIENDAVQCPDCGKQCPLPGQKVSNLPISLLHSQVKKAKSKYYNGESGADVTHNTLCCSAGCSQQAVMFCKVCKYICSECENSHKRESIFNDHTLIPLHEGIHCQRKEFPACSMHTDKVRPLGMYCTKCVMPICSACYMESHTGDSHKITRHDKIACEAADELENTTKNIQSFLVKTQKIQDNVKYYAGKLIASADYTKMKATQKMLKIKKEVLYLKHEIEKIVHESYVIGNNKLQDVTRELDTLLINLRSIDFYTNQLLIYGTPCDYTTHIKTIERLQTNVPNNITYDLPELDTTDADKLLHDFKVVELNVFCF